LVKISLDAWGSSNALWVEAVQEYISSDGIAFVAVPYVGSNTNNNKKLVNKHNRAKGTLRTQGCSNQDELDTATFLYDRSSGPAQLDSWVKRVELVHTVRSTIRPTPL